MQKNKTHQHLFIDDIIIFTKGELQSLQGVMNFMGKFSNMTKLVMNLNKLTLLLGSVPRLEADVLSISIGIKLEDLPIRYLGLPLCASRISSKECLQMIEKITERIKLWHLSLLSFTGHLELIRSVLTALCTC